MKLRGPAVGRRVSVAASVAMAAAGTLVLAVASCADRPLHFPLGDLGVAPAGDLVVAAARDLAVPPPRDLALRGSPDLTPVGCTVCAAGHCGTQVSATMTDGKAPSDWSFNVAPMAASGASYDAKADVAVLNQSLAHSAGSIFYRVPIATDVVDIRFDARIIPGTGGDHADGMAFVLVHADPGAGDIATAVGAWGGSLGMTSATALGSTIPLSGFGVELDCYDNDNPSSRCGESIRGEHVNIDTLAPCSIGGTSSLPTPVSSPVAVKLADGLWRTVAIHVDNGLMTVSIIVKGSENVLFKDVALPGFLSGDAYFYGFTGATGDLTERHEIRNVTFTFPTERCL